jgi:enoyl-CoA hydratase/carnithine racemase
MGVSYVTLDNPPANSYADRLAAGPALAIAAIKRCVHEGGQLPLDDGLALEAELVEQLFRSKDATEGLTAFVEKRNPEFVGA